MENFDLFDGLEDELEGITLDAGPAQAEAVEVVAEEVTVQVVEEAKPMTVEEAKASDKELTDEEMKAIEAQAAAESKPVDDVDSFFDQISEETTKEKAKPKKAVEKAAPAPKEPEYKGPRSVRVYGQELWIETDDSKTLEDIRKRIVEDYQYPEFKEDRTAMVMDEEGIVTAHVKFQKKG